MILETKQSIARPPQSPRLVWSKTLSTQNRKNQTEMVANGESDKLNSGEWLLSPRGPSQVFPKPVLKLFRPKWLSDRGRFNSSRQRIEVNQTAGTNINKTMQLKVTIISDRADEYVGKKGLVKSQIITCQDVDPSGFRLLMPFDYTLSDEEKTKWAGKLQDKQIVLGVRELNPFGGRLRARGAIVTGPDGKN
jgi:hypothetical protein